MSRFSTIRITLYASRFTDVLTILARLAVGSVLLYAGFMKAVGPAPEFAAILETYKLFPPSLLSPLSIAVPYVEMWVGLFILTGFYTRQAAFAAAALFAAFLVALISTLVRGIDLASCGCFGPDALSPRYTMIMDTILLALSLSACKLAKLPSSLSLDRFLPKV
jgi:uncharacterized membrane protein YphA (DoxX/SURF4 family)